MGISTFLLDDIELYLKFSCILHFFSGALVFATALSISFHSIFLYILELLLLAQGALIIFFLKQQKKTKKLPIISSTITGLLCAVIFICFPYIVWTGVLLLVFVVPNPIFIWKEFESGTSSELNDLHMI
eukprot:TRINITY_DN2167_c0_g1_i1.p1 TRINITY_DN2167_c0_g1~~TRINITY_DN2167_c0_g1_i1.p1  ORF type:complete len:141 (+),score=14.95 TRINITY_DN2167_c0_g1_i1:38-424(+)